MFSADVIQELLSGVLITVQVTAYSVALGTVISIAGGVASLSGVASLRWLTRVYVEIFRGVSAIILLFWVYFALPQLFDIFLSPLQAATLALGTNMGAYGTELVRGAIQSIPAGQTEAAIAVNLNAYQRLRYVILPQAFVTMLPPYGNLLIEILKATALVSLIDLSDITERAQYLRSLRVAESAQIFAVVLVIYFVLSGLITLVVRALEGHFGQGLDIGVSKGRGRGV